MKKELQQLKKLESFDAVFFDIFDTIVKRTVEPEYTKKIWSTNLVKILELDGSPQQIYDLRNKLEAELCQKTAQKGLDLEFKYNDLATSMYIELKQQLKNSITHDGFREICVELEEKIESSAQEIDTDVVDIIKFLKENNKKVYCVSDMYLSKKMIKNIFTEHGIVEYFDDIFMSEAYSVSKRSGRLYDLVLGKTKFNPKRVVMVGDNKHSDYDMPISKNMQAIWLDRSTQREFNEQFLEKVDTAKIVTEVNEILSTPLNVPFVNLAGSLYMFIDRLYFKLIANNCKDVIFFSREGQFLKELFDSYQETVFGTKIKSHYIYVSRKSTYLPSLKKLPEEKFDALLNQYSYNSIENFLKSIGFSDDDISKIHNSIGIKKDIKKMSYDFRASASFKGLIKDKMFMQLYERNRKIQSEAFRMYFNSFGLKDNKNCTVVDVGWKGSIQTNVQNILKNVKVTGYYFGLHTFENLDDREALVFSNVPSLTKNFNLYNENRSLFEIVLGANHGSTSHYEKTDKKSAEPIIVVEKAELELYSKKILPLQKEIFKKFQSIKCILQNRIYDFGLIEKEFNKAHYLMLFKPTNAEIDFFNKVYHYENFGLFSFTKFNEQKNYSNKLREYAKYFLKHQKYIEDFYWPQLKNYNNKMPMIAKFYAFERYVEFKRKGII